MVNGKNIKSIRPTKKLDHKMLGPVKIKGPVGLYAYELNILVFVGRPHPVHNISLHEPYHTNQIAGR